MAAKKQSTKEEKALAVIEAQPVVSDRQLTRQDRLEVAQVVEHAVIVRKVMESVMKEGMHYGTIPGTTKPTLYQPGAQVLALTFQLRPQFEVTKTDLGNGHREIEVKTTILNVSGDFMGHGVGSCSTMESKYRYRGQANFERTGKPVPPPYWGLKNDHDKRRALAQLMDDSSSKFGVKNVAKAGERKQWEVVKFSDDGAMIENPNIADVWNTVLKISKKRSYVDGILNCTGASDVFTQDLEELEENLDALQEATGMDMQPVARDREPKVQPEQNRKPSGWRNVTVHIKCKVSGKKLGELDLAYMRVLQEQWVAKFDFQKSTYEDRQLRKALAEALGELEMEEAKAKGTQEQTHSTEENFPTQGTLKETQKQKEPLLDSKEEQITRLRGMLIEAELDEQDFIEELAKRNGWPLEAMTLDAIEDESFAQFLGDNFRKYLDEWGFTATPVATQPPTKKGRKKK